MDNHMVSGDTVSVVVRTCRYPGIDLREVVGVFGVTAQAAAFAAKRNGEQSSFLYTVLTAPLDREDPDGLDAAQEEAREASYLAAPPAPLPDALDRPDGPGLSTLEAVYRGFPVSAKRVRESHWCGYLTVPKDHPWVEVGCRDRDGRWGEPDENRLSLDVHGGCTFAALSEGGGLRVGFDCAHGGDGKPPWSQERSFLWGTYRDLAFVRRELLGLAEQAEQAARDANG